MSMEALPAHRMQSLCCKESEMEAFKELQFKSFLEPAWLASWPVLTSSEPATLQIAFSRGDQEHCEKTKESTSYSGQGVDGSS
jgi:hypothetical protein